MSLSIQILTGYRQGEHLLIDKLTTLGRSADISFEDPKMSKIHAVFEFEPSLGWLLRDPGAKNGVFVNGHKAQQHLLNEGDIIDIGTTQIRVSALSASWKPALNQVLLEAHDIAKNSAMSLIPFRIYPVFTITQGLQAGDAFLLEYGPRVFGGDCDDFLLYEPQCPDIAFSISPTQQGTLFETKYPKIVKINGASEEKKLLKNSDLIFIHNTVLEVTFVST